QPRKHYYWTAKLIVPPLRSATGRTKPSGELKCPTCPTAVASWIALSRTGTTRSACPTGAAIKPPEIGSRIFISVTAATYCDLLKRLEESAMCDCMALGPHGWIEARSISL